ncbi:hypothetical protein [Robertmurraya andreesenii]|uniref:Uncharacterized protein n=1 Tax=Anoxybacillus andreesenii TaxID=1325932 RepID=A0ABT9V020_9BACL|nr:hypothetical protein [Robertmurraya andreesenii]MDQ0154263.1 hypothetical protein [Robertmurraya andreesenii]
MTICPQAVPGTACGLLSDFVRVGWTIKGVSHYYAVVVEIYG